MAKEFWCQGCGYMHELHKHGGKAKPGEEEIAKRAGMAKKVRPAAPVPKTEVQKTIRAELELMAADCVEGKGPMPESHPDCARCAEARKRKAAKMRLYRKRRGGK
jgi:hypothetical protein